MQPVLSKKEIFELVRIDRAANRKTDLLYLAFLIAFSAHDGQMRRSGRPHIEHVLQVAADHPKSIAQIIERLLHDTIEDTRKREPAKRWTADDFRYLGFPEDIVGGVKILTKDLGQLYYDFIHKVGCGREQDIENKDSDMSNNMVDCDADHTLQYKLSRRYLADIKRGHTPRGTLVGIWMLRNADAPENWASFKEHSSERLEEVTREDKAGIYAQMAGPL